MATKKRQRAPKIPFEVPEFSEELKECVSMDPPDIPRMRKLIAEGADPNGLEIIEGNAFPAGPVSFYSEDPAVWEFFLTETNMNPNICDYIDKQTMLHRCARGHWWEPKHREPILKLLLKCGADVNAADREGQTPLDFAINNHAPKKIIDLLCKGGAVRSGKKSEHDDAEEEEEKEEKEPKRHRDGKKKDGGKKPLKKKR